MKRFVPILVVLLLSCCALALAAELNGTVVGVTDGDTITVLDATKTQYKIRLDGIDAPESSQAFGSKAKQALSSLVFGKAVTVQYQEKDRYGRILGRVLIDGKDASFELVSAGMAWHYKQYSDDEKLATAEETARAAKLGLWSGDAPMPPWDFRRSGSKPQPAAGEGTAGPFWITTSSGVVHNSGCRYYRKTAGSESADGVGGSGDCKRCGGTAGSVPLAVQASPQAPAATATSTNTSGVAQKRFWITTSSGVVHNSGCRYYRNSSGSESADGAGGSRDCKVCGGTGGQKPDAKGPSVASPQVQAPAAPAASAQAGGGQCAATTKKGTRCKRNASAGSAHCWQHQ